MSFFLTDLFNSMERSQVRELRDPPPNTAPPSSTQKSVSTMASPINNEGVVGAPSSPDRAMAAVSGSEDPPPSTGNTHGFPSRRSGRDVFDFMALSGELRNMIYTAVIDTMATTPDTPIALLPKSGCMRRYSCWLGDEDESYEKNAGLTDCDSSEDDGYSVTFKAQLKRERKKAKRIANLRRNFATCCLGEVSRQVRSEFVPLLFERLHFRMCHCFTSDWHDGSRPPIKQLAGKIRSLDYYTHSCTWSTGDELGEVFGLLNILLQLRFSGELKIVGFSDYAAMILECLEAFCFNTRRGESKSKAQERASEMILPRIRLFHRGASPFEPGSNIVELPFHFNYIDFSRKRARSV